MVRVLIFLLKTYRYLFSPYLPSTCRFYPSCSQYAVEALERRGLLKGAVLSLQRLLRCNPFLPGGYDPVE